MSLPPKYQLERYLLDPEECRRTLIREEILPTLRECPMCHGPVSLVNNASTWKCSRKNCRHGQTVFYTTFFERSRISCNRVLEFGYNWLLGMQSNQLKQYFGMSSNTVADWIQNYQQLIELDLESRDIGEKQIGGDGIIVQIDEAKFGKRKFNRGHRVQGVWVVGGVEITEERKVFAVSVPDRSGATLLAIIREHVAPGSHIFTDCWAGYRTEDLEAHEFEHVTVNHNEGFIDHETGVHTNNIEATWRGMRFHMSHKHMNRALIDGHLKTFIWKRHYRGSRWGALLNAIKRVDWHDLEVADEDDV